ncbi:MAG: CpaF family protein [Coriobacteriales bacterium]|jgi:pilus assembly protein CpaF|nr:CpaF family protein [Coriobacteriales bacterium]
MPLLEYLQKAPAHHAQGSVQNRRRADKTQLRDALYQRLPSERIAQLLAQDRERAEREVRAVLEQMMLDAPYQGQDASQQHSLIQEILHAVVGLGPLEELLGDPAISEIMVNGHERVFFERQGRIYKSDVAFDDEQQLRMVIDRIVGPLGRRVDEQSPLVSARLKQGHRVNVVIPPLALDGPILTIRKFRDEAFTLTELVERGSMDTRIARLLRWSVIGRRNIAVSGGTGSGKTTLLNALSVEIPSSERIITIEDAAELRFTTHPHVVRLEARMKNSEGTGEVSIRDLMVNALRMRPDRIVVGECRGAEALDMLQAMNTGHDGSLTTLHANSPADVVSRLIMMARYGMDLPVEVIEEQIGSALDLVVQIDRAPDGTRRVTRLCSCESCQGGARLDTLVEWDFFKQSYLWCSQPSWFAELIRACSLSKEEVSSWRSSLSLP